MHELSLTHKRLRKLFFFPHKNSLQVFFFFFNFCLSVEEDGSMNKRHGLITCNERLG